METENKKPENPNAFPSFGNNGMTLRDYFANSAMQGMMANPYYGIFDGQNKVHIPTIEQCYEIADAMLKQREL